MKDQHSILFIVGALSLVVASVLGDAYLKEAPLFFKPCALSDPTNGVCLANALENVFSNWREGIPGLKNLGSIDPFYVKKVHLEQNNQNINFKINLKDVIITGLSQSKVTKASVNHEYNFKLVIKIPLLKSKGDYRMKGSILLLRLDSNGSMESEVSDVDVIFFLKCKLIEVNNHKFLDISSIQSSVKNIGKFHISFSNLFNDNMELEESANAVFNQNWHELFEIMRPVIEETLDAIALDRFKKIFGYFPASYFFVDLP